ncbi:outer membrane protein assembly factor BamB family protein [Roseimarinus sediminis]|uniref:outer membrane protein assembly factor BamB family protein n=1 Tax=Roseimarinus sediminis TaxID=1610899 RepID=UPI003D20297B
MGKLLLGVLLLFSSTLFGQTSKSWPNSRGNVKLHGITSASFPQSVQLQWTFDADGIFKAAPVIHDNKIVVGSTNGTVYCLNFQGDSLWGFATDNAIEAPALIDDGLVFIGNLSGTLFALDLETGKQRWAYHSENQIMGAPTLINYQGEKILAVGSYDYYLHGINARTGASRWKYETDNFLNSAPALSVDQAVFGGCDGFLHQVNMLTGKLQAKIEVATYVASSPAVLGNRAYIGDYDGGFTCIDLQQEKIIWRYQNPDNDLPFIASPSLLSDKVLIGSRDKFLYCFNTENGQLLWKRNTGSRIDASTVVNRHQVLVVNMRGDLMLLNHSDGSEIWTYQLGTGVINTPAVIENTIVVAASDGNVYFFSQP